MKLHTKRKTPEITKYYFAKDTNEEREIAVVTCEKDLGITTDSHLTFAVHIQDKVNKANRIMGMIRRTFVSLDITTFRYLFKAMVRPHVEYAQSVWAPHYKKDIKSVENILRRASKMIPGLKNLTYPERLKVLELPTMIYRRIRGDMIEVFKILNNKYDVDVTM